MNLDLDQAGEAGCQLHRNIGYKTDARQQCSQYFEKFQSNCEDNSVFQTCPKPPATYFECLSDKPLKASTELGGKELHDLNLISQ